MLVAASLALNQAGEGSSPSGRRDIELIRDGLPGKTADSDPAERGSTPRPGIVGAMASARTLKTE